MNDFLKPWISVYDVVDLTYIVFTIIGAASFSRARRSDAKTVYFKDKCDSLRAIAISLLALTGLIMLFFYSPYVTETSLIDKIFYDSLFCLVCAAGITTRLLAASRADLFLTALNLIEEVDAHMRNRRIYVNCKKAEYLFKLFVLIPIGCIVVFISYYHEDTTREEDNLYEIIHMSLCFAMSYLSIGAQLIYLLTVNITITDRLQHLSDYIDKLKISDNPKIIEQEVVVVSQLHFKLCQSWKLTIKAYGLSQVCIMLVAYVYSLVPMCILGYILPELNKVSLLPAIVLLVLMPKLIQLFRDLRDTAEEFKSHVIGLCLEKKDEKNVNLVCKTLLLQVEHWNIDLMISGFMKMDPQSYLEGLKTVSTVVMFLVQIKTP